MVDFGSHGRLGQRHMADRCSESKAVHINQSATGTQALMGWRLVEAAGGQKQNPTPNSLQIAAPPISGLLQVSASFLRRRASVPVCLRSGHHSTCWACLHPLHP